MKSIILAGGSGTRLWPISRESYPKQFIKLNGQSYSLFQEAFLRSLSLSQIDDIYIITNEKYKLMVIEAIEQLGHSAQECNILIEPEAKNTLPAVYAGVFEIVKKEHDTVVVFPSDHIISKNKEFLDIIVHSEKLAQSKLITFGIKPDSPNTGYGYISPGDAILNGFSVKSFKEKPSIDNAIQYIKNGYFWNAGIFMFRSELFMSEVQNYSPEIYHAFDSTTNISEAFTLINNKISIDYGIMEKSFNVAVVPISIGWNDLGSFDAFYDVFPSDKNGNIAMNNKSVLIDSKNILVHANKNKIITTIGIEDLIVIDEDDAMLICKKNSSQGVKEVVNILNENKDNRIDLGSKNVFEWGTSEIISTDHKCKISKLSISIEKPTVFMAKDIEHWIVTKECIQTKVGNVIKTLSQGESFALNKGDNCFIENKGEKIAEIIKIDLNLN